MIYGIVYCVTMIRITNTIEYDETRRIIKVRKEKLTMEDTIALAFSRILEKENVRYAIVAGYVALLFGRSRRSDDVDFIIENISLGKFASLCEKLFKAGFKFLHSNEKTLETVRMAYHSLEKGDRIRFTFGEYPIPNVEMKFATTRLDKISIEESMMIHVNEDVLRISPLELQIAYKLYLGSEKDVEDARFLYKLFKNILDGEKLSKWCRLLDVNLKCLES